MNLAAIQQALREERLDGWLFFDHHERDPLAYRVLGFTAPRTPTRRWYYFIPAAGEPQRLVHRIEAGMLDALEGVKTVYSSWQTQASGLTAILGGAKRVAMQYSPNCAVFTLSMVDAGTVELIRGLGVEVVTSANLIQYFEARWTPEKLDSHIAASSLVDNARRAAFARIGDKLRAGERVGEYEIQQFILGEFAKAGLVTDHGPIVGVNENASNPHYEPTEEHHAEIKKGDIVLIDLWAKLNGPGSVYYDVTWTGFAGSQPTSEMENVFAICMGGRDAGINRVTRGVAAGEELTLDYGTIDHDAEPMACRCGAATCRGTITGEDWRRHDLQQKYGDHFAWHLLRRMCMER